MKRLLIFLLFSFVALDSAYSQQLPSKKERTVAFTSARNLSGDPRADYLGGIVQGLIAYDISRSEGITLVDRASLDKVLSELELQLTGLVDNTAAASKVGKLLGADFLLSVEFVIISGETIITAKSVEISSGRQVSFVERGSSENTVHRLSESLVEYYSGEKQSFVNPSFERSILTLRDETPGSIALHSIMRHAELFLDGEFIGYSTGSVEVPYIFDGLKPGKHTIRVHVGRGFGIVKQPQITFSDWETSVEIRPGKRIVVRDETRDFNSILYRLRELISQDLYYEKGKEFKTYTAKFTDRSGKPVDVSVALVSTEKNGVLSVSSDLKVNSETKNWTLEGKAGQSTEMVQEYGKVQLKVTLDLRYDKPRIRLYVERTDIWQNMYD
jgi:TolB-like protein